MDEMTKTDQAAERRHWDRHPDPGWPWDGPSWRALCYQGSLLVAATEEDLRCLKLLPR